MFPGALRGFLGRLEVGLGPLGRGLGGGQFLFGALEPLRRGSGRV